MSGYSEDSLLLSTPLNPRKYGNAQFRASREKNDVQRLKVEQEMRGSFVGPMSIQTFFDDFMEPAHPSGECPPADFSQVAKVAKDEKLMYDPIVSLLSCTRSKLTLSLPDRCR